MASTGSGAQVQSCPGCGGPIETVGLEPFAKVNCPACGKQVRVERVFEHFTVVEPLGTGGMGSVYKARDARLNRFVALKLLRKEFADDASFTAKLKEEARVTGSIKHPHVVEVFSVGEDHGQFYVVMELVDGGSLDDRMEDEKRIPELQTLELGIQVAKGLQAALKAGLIHRDIKPGNILFADRNTAKIVDFGLALFAAQHAGTENEIWGTPYYVAPERLTSEPEDFRSDLYSLGATLFHASSGRPTFKIETQSATELKKLKADPIKLKKVAPDISDETAAVIDQMLRPDPAARQSSYKELIAQLESARSEFLAREEELRGRWGWPLRVVVSLGVLLVAGAILFGIVVGLQHLPQQTAGSRASQEASTTSPTPVADVQAKLESARHELQAGHYGTAEALFRELSQSVSNVQPAADLCAALQLWERGSFAEAAAALQHFVEIKPVGLFGWLNAFKPLAEDRLHDYQLYTEWQKTRDASKDPEMALQRIRDISTKLKAKGALAFQFADEEAKLAAQVAQVSEKKAADEKRRAEEEGPRWQAVLVAERKTLAAYDFEGAAALLKQSTITAASLQSERDAELQRVSWLADWKKKLISDINGTGYGGVVRDIHGVRYDGPVRRATKDKLELKTRYGSVMTGWLNLPPDMLLKMSTAFIRPGIADVAERQWLCAIFAAQTGQTAAANDLAEKAAGAKGNFRDLLPRFFPTAKK
jgi:serine/threonine protein kinase